MGQNQCNAIQSMSAGVVFSHTAGYCMVIVTCLMYNRHGHLNIFILYLNKYCHIMDKKI